MPFCFFVSFSFLKILFQLDFIGSKNGSISLKSFAQYVFENFCCFLCIYYRKVGGGGRKK